MFCPLKFPGIVDVDGEHKSNECHCEENECAWWDDDAEMCACRSIAFLLGKWGTYLETLADQRGERG